MIFVYVITALLRYAYAQGSGAGNSCPSSYTVHPDYPNLCIYVNSNSYSEWQHATCPDGGSLALPYNRLIHEYIISFLDLAETYYFGLNINTSNGVLQWEDGEMLLERFEVWAHLVNVSEGCAYYFNNGSQWEWDITVCNESKLSICQYVIPNISPNVWLLDGVFEGRVEIYHANRWGTLTHTNPPSSLGVVICNMLNLAFVDYNVSSAISDGTGPVWLDGVDCTVLLSTVNLCAVFENVPWGHASASHTTDVKVRCQEPVPVCNISDVPSVAYAGQSCTSVTPITCTVTCVTLPNGSVYLHTNGLQSITYSCSEVTGMWTPALPPLECELSLTSSSTVCMTATTTTTTTMTETITDTITTSMTDTVTMTTMQTLQPSQCIQTTAQSVQTYSLYTPTQTDIYSQSISPSSVVDGTVQPTTSQERPLPIPKHSKRTSAMFSTRTKEDNRPSAIAIGSFGVIILASLLGSALFLDMITIGKERQVFQDVRKAPKGPHRPRRSPDGRESEVSMPETASGASSAISLNESDTCPSEITENSPVKEGLQTMGIVQIHPTPHRMNSEAFPLSMKLLDIPVANLCMPSDEDTGRFSSFPSRPFNGDVLDIPSRFTYQEPGESIKSVDADIEMGRLTKTKENLPTSPCPEALYDNESH